MSALPQTFADDVINQSARIQFDTFLDEHRRALNASLDGLTEEQARRRLVTSRTTLLGLVKHATFVEKVWFDEAITRRSRADIGIPASPDESFILDEHDTIASIQTAHQEACEASRRAVAELGLDDLLLGTAEDRSPSAGSTSTCCGSSRSTAAMRISCGSRSPGRDHRAAGCPKNVRPR